MKHITTADLVTHPEWLSLAEYWRIYMLDSNGKTLWAFTLPATQLAVLNMSLHYCPLDIQFYGHESCYPVNIDHNETETRLEVPKLDDEIQIDEWKNAHPHWQLRGWGVETGNGTDWQWCLEGSRVRTDWLKPPTRDHVPRKSLDFGWVWTTIDSKIVEVCHDGQ